MLLKGSEVGYFWKDQKLAASGWMRSTLLLEVFRSLMLLEVEALEMLLKSVEAESF